MNIIMIVGFTLLNVWQLSKIADLGVAFWISVNTFMIIMLSIQAHKEHHHKEINK